MTKTSSIVITYCSVPRMALLRKTLLEQYSRPRQNGVNAITIREDDRVIEVRMTNGNNEIIIANRNGRAIRFHENAVRVMGRTATGVRGMTLDEDGQDEVVGMICIKDPESLKQLWWYQNKDMVNVLTLKIIAKQTEAVKV